MIFPATFSAAACAVALALALPANAAQVSSTLRPTGDAVLRLPLSDTDMDKVYGAVGHRLLWQVAADREALRAAIAGLESHGLTIAGFAPALAAIDRAGEGAATPEDDLAISRGAVRYARALRGQLIRFAALDDDWAIRPEPYDAAAELGRAAVAGDLATYLASQAPTSGAYHALQTALLRYRSIEAEGGWPKVPDQPEAPPPPALEQRVAQAPPDPANASDLTIAKPSALPPNAVLPDGTIAPAEPPKFPVLEPGARDSRVPPLRARLAAEGEPVAGADDLYDAALVEAMKRFQARHGLLVDGRVGERSFRALNTSAGYRARQIELNLERLRWEPRAEPTRMVRVNVPDAQADLLENGARLLRMRVVVGTRKTSTPALASAIDRITVWPRWTLPYSIASKEQLPKLKQNANHLAEQNIIILGRDGDPHGRDIDWSAYSAGDFPFRLQQRPGPDNALGTFRFNFDNRFAVYLHDTPKKKGFARSVRAASHGCVRLEDARGLALALLGRDKGLGEAEIDELLAAQRTRDIMLNAPVPVRLVYFTAFIESDGQVHFRSDLYDRDTTLARAMERARS
jgi:murein L,D-transpeptidase YcbB/YkuD